jgi:hypothetical protein
MTGATAPTSSVGSPKTVPIRVCDGVIVHVSFPEYRLLFVSRSVMTPSAGPWVTCR